MIRTRHALSLVTGIVLALALVLAGVADAADPSFALGPGGVMMGPANTIVFTELCPGDFNGDGNTDVAAGIAVSAGTNGVYAAYGDGNGNLGGFSLVAGITGGSSVATCAAGDFSGDGRTDLAIGDSGATGVQVALSTGPAFNVSPVATTANTKDLESGRLDPGAVLDLAVAQAGTPGAVLSLLGNGSGGFAPPAGTAPSSGGNDPTRIHLGDLNGDGRDDAVVTHPPAGSNTTATLLSTPTGLMASQEVDTGSTADFSLGDVNGDFRLDEIQLAGNKFQIRPGDGNGNLGTALVGVYPDPTVAAISTLTSLALRDFNGDGRLDVLAGDDDMATPTDFWAFAGTGGPADPLFSETAIGPIIANPSAPGFPTATVGAEMNNDDHLDAIAAMSVPGTPRISVLLNTTPIPPGLLSPPDITGNPVVGNTLTCQPGGWTGRPTFTYQWFRNGAAIAGQTLAPHTVIGNDAGTALSCRVTAQNSGGAVSALSASVNVPGIPGVTCIVPEVKGLKIKAAKQKLEEAGCKFGKIAGRKRRRGRHRRAIGTEPHAGLVANAPVDIIVRR